MKKDKNITIRISPRMLQRLRELAEAADCRPAEAVRRLILKASERGRI